MLVFVKNLISVIAKNINVLNFNGISLEFLTPSRNFESVVTYCFCEKDVNPFLDKFCNFIEGL